MREFPVTVVEVEECRDMNPSPDPNRPGFLSDLKPWPGSERYFLQLRLSTGAVIRAQLTKEDFNTFLTIPECNDDVKESA